ncbi:MAG: hypothetical protein J3K34DRAFT_37778 [Monoraphidium minutum]|nr:MAG: hypothetical protein J3K34DRAFT_37778 [Monoraphidium minutum]
MQQPPRVSAPPLAFVPFAVSVWRASCRASCSPNKVCFRGARGAPLCLQWRPLVFRSPLPNGDHLSFALLSPSPGRARAAIKRVPQARRAPGGAPCPAGRPLHGICALWASVQPSPRCPHSLLLLPPAGPEPPPSLDPGPRNPPDRARHRRGPGAAGARR